MKTGRQTNFELLRVMAMLMVMIHHALVHGAILRQYNAGSTGYAIFWLVNSFCNVAVNCYVLITGYFMVTSEFKISRIIKLVVQVEFYSILCAVITHFYFGQTVNVKNLVVSIFPLTSSAYWFASRYVVLLMITPMLNWTIRHMTQKELVNTICILIVVFCVIPVIFYLSRSWVNDGKNIVQFVVLYYIAAYLRLYGKTDRKKALMLYILLCATACLTAIFGGMVSNKIFGETKPGYFFTYNSILFLPAAVCLFIVFSGMKIKKEQRIMNALAKMGALSFGAYLWTDHSIIRIPLWKMIDVSENYQHIGLTLIHMTVVAVALFAIGCLIEWIRLKLMQLLQLPRFFEICDGRFEIVKEKFERYLDEKIITNKKEKDV